MGIRRMKDFNKIFPTEIVSEILTRLPTETVLECKSVCKTWNNLINHPSFSRRHLARLNHPDSTDSGKLRYVSLDFKYSKIGYYRGYDFYYFKYNDDEDWNYVKPIHRDIMSETIPYEDYIVIGSCNGLICVYGYDITECAISGSAIIFNPVVKEYISLSDYNDKFVGYYKGSTFHYLGCGFGYLAETNEYKVVRMFTHVSEPSAIELEVYTVGSDKGWRHAKFDVGITVLCFTCYEEQHAVFLNGALHWRNAEGGMVLVLNRT